jgi:arginine N-succinyltransferase
VANEQYTNFRAMLVRTNPKCERLVLTAANWMP